MRLFIPRACKSSHNQVALIWRPRNRHQLNMRRDDLRQTIPLIQLPQLGTAHPVVVAGYSWQNRSGFSRLAFPLRRDPEGATKEVLKNVLGRYCKGFQKRMGRRGTGNTVGYGRVWTMSLQEDFDNDDNFVFVGTTSLIVVCCKFPK